MHDYLPLKRKYRPGCSGIEPFLFVETNEIPEFRGARSKFMNSHWMKFKIPGSDEI